MKKEHHSQENHHKSDPKSSKTNRIFLYAAFVPLAVQLCIQLIFKVDYEQLILHPYSIILHTTVGLFVGSLVEKKHYIAQYFLMLAGLFCYGLASCMTKPLGIFNIFTLFAGAGIVISMFAGATISFVLAALIQKYKEQYKKFLPIAFALIFLGFFVYNIFIVSKIICVYKQENGQPMKTMRIHYYPEDEKNSYRTTASLQYTHCFVGPNSLYEELKTHQAFQFFNRGLDFMNGSNAHQDSVDAKYTLDGTKLYLTLPEGHYELL